MKKARWQKEPWAYALIAGISACSSLYLRKRAELFHEYNGDIDTFLYQAWRLLSGQLNYIDHYDSKLPIVPYLYVPSFLTGSFSGHRAIADLVIMASAFLVYRIVSHANKNFLAARGREASNGGIAAAGLFIFFGSILPDTAYSGHLFLYSTFFVLSGLLLISEGIVNGKASIIATGGVICGLAIQTRPNTLFSIFGLVTAFITSWFFYNRDSISPEVVLKSIRQISTASWGGFMGFLLPFLPYIFEGSHRWAAYNLSYRLLSVWRRDVFGWDGLADFTASIQYLYTPRLFGLPYLILLPVPALIVVTFSILLREDKKGTVPIYFGLLGYVAGGLLSYYYSHTFPNYAFSDVWVFCALLGSGFGFTGEKWRGIQRLRWNTCTTFITSGTLAIALVLQAYRLERQDDSRTYFMPSDLLLTIRGSSFSSPQNYSLYWRLKQKSPTFGVHTHWTEYANFKIKDKQFLKEHGFSTSVDETCEAYLDPRNKYLVLFDKEQFICEDFLGRGWRLLREYTYKKEGSSTRVYINSLFN